jgi:hypothetical protein
VIFLLGFLFHFGGTDAKGIEYGCSTQRSTSEGRVGVPDYIYGMSVKFCLMVGKGAKVAEYSGYMETITPFGTRRITRMYMLISINIPAFHFGLVLLAWF